MMLKSNFITTLAIIIMPVHFFAQDNYDKVLFDEANAFLSLVHYELDFESEIKDQSTMTFEDSIRQDVFQEIYGDILEASLDKYETIIEDYPESDLLYRAINNAAYLCSLLENIEESVRYYQLLLESNARDSEEGGIGSGIMAEPYALYKNRACRALAETFLDQGNFVEALKYLKLTKKYPYQHFCGNELSQNDIYEALLYGKIYWGLEDKEKALEHLLPEVIYDGLANNEEVVDLAVSILRENYSQEELNSEVDKALSKIQSRKKGRHYSTYFMGAKIIIPGTAVEWGFLEAYEKENNSPSANQLAVRALKQSPFLQKLLAEE